MDSCLFFLSLSSLLLTTADGGDVRLVNGGSPCAGRVEVLHDGQWGTVLGEQWNINAATVVCRELGCGAAVEAPGEAHFGEGSGKIWMAMVICMGSESTLKDCISMRWGIDRMYPRHDKDAGVICSGTFGQLVGGPHQCSGRVEFSNGDTMCDAVFDQHDAEVLCRELGCGVPEVLRAAAFGEGEGQVWSEEIQCKGNESQLINCPRSSIQNESCSHKQDVGVTCFGYSNSRLVNGSDSCSGRVELQYSSEWGSVCDACWDMRAATVLCQQLGCGTAVAIPGQAWFGEGSGPIWTDVFECQGNETRLSQCTVSSWNRAACSHGQDAGVVCSGSNSSVIDGQVRLSGENGCEGQVEVYYQQTWRRVLLDTWGFNETSVVCRQLGCGSAEQVQSSSPSGGRNRDDCVTDYRCSGVESHLGNCGAPDTLTCSSSQQVSIVCSSEYNRSLRLVGGGGDCAGRLEVFHRGSWGTVCDDSWDLEDAQVVCRQLRCGTALSVPSPSPYGPGTGAIWLDEVGCVGNETSLRECHSAEWGQHNCGHQKDVGIICSEFKQLRLGMTQNTEGCEGQAEVFYNGTWGSVCMNDMVPDTARVICRQLGCGDAVGFQDGTTSLPPDAPRWLDNVQCRPHDTSLWQCQSSPWGQNDCSPNEVAVITCTGPKRKVPSLETTLQSNKTQVHQQKELRLASPRNCSGRVEVQIGGSWGSICNDFWDMREAEVVCRQLGCGEALRPDENSTSTRGDGSFWLDEIKCRGTELYLWDCPHSVLRERSCRDKEDAGVTCAGEPKRPTVTQPPSGISISNVAFLVLGALLFLLLALLFVQVSRTRALKRALSQGKQAPIYEAVYEEIEYKETREEAYSTPRRGSVISEDLPSGYEDVGDGEADAMSGELMTEDTPENYDDVVPIDQTASNLSRGVLTGDTTEYYDDVMSVGQSADVEAAGRVLATLSPEEGLPAPDGLDYDDVGEEPQFG
ncbi:scavenger receptor cysteine-rich type 1 protein M130-like [Megalops cyprinoides]|uniref:scavenger receptor cysteine-rich type 1 protein M130-like n=1 Tax=Megalops cyprinoides TaxID=118141 RepID=UPI001863C401|nr:scavenger receptor cysteine-rich type 1 protein M130-like [Megalops cyprinoides]